MLTRTIDQILIHHFETSKSALLIECARKVGKTSSIREFGKRFSTFIEINFEKQPEAVMLFKKLNGAKDLLARLSLLTDKVLIKEETSNIRLSVSAVNQTQSFLICLKDLVRRCEYLILICSFF